MAGIEDVSGYTKIVNGKAVVVRPHSRTNNEVAEASKKLPGRPMVTAQSGAFPGGRSVPNLWPQDVQKEVIAEEEETAEEDKVLPPAKSLREAAQRVIDELKNYQDTPAAQKVKQLLMEANYDDFYLAAEDQEVLELAVRASLGKGVVAVRNYTRVVNGKVIHVRAYTQIRDLLSKFGGPTMAAKKGITQNLLVDAMQISNKLPKGQAAKTVSKVKSATKAAQRVSPSTKETLNKAKAPKTTPATSSSRSVGRSSTSSQPKVTKPTVEDDAPENNPPQTRSKSKVRAQKETPKPTKRQFKHPTGNTFDLEPGDVVKQHRSNPQSLGVYGSDGTMKYRILPSGKKGKVPNVVNDAMWRDYEERGTVRDFAPEGSTRRSPSTDPDTPPDAPKPVRKTFTHPKGNDYVLSPGDKVMRHRTQPGAYMVQDKDGNVKYRITPSGKVSESEINPSFYEDLPDNLADAPEVDQPTTPDTPSTSFETIREDRSEAWNRGANAALDGPGDGDPMSDPWVRERSEGAEVGGEDVSRDIQDFTKGYDYALDQERWWRQEALGERVPSGIQLDEAFRPSDFTEPEDTVESPDDRVATAPSIPTTTYDEDQPEAWNWGVSWFQENLTAFDLLNRVAEALSERDANPEQVQVAEKAAMEGFYYAAQQKNTFDKWVEGVEPPVGFTFDKILYPEAKNQLEEARLKQVLTGPDLDDNESWRKTTFTDAEKWKKAGYEQFRPGFEQQPEPWQIPEFQSEVLSTPDAENRSREEQIRQGFKIAEKEWSQANKVEPSVSGEQNRGAQYFTSTNKPLPPSATDGFRKGYVEARQELAKQRLEEGNFPVTQEALESQAEIIEAARKAGRDVAPLTGESRQTILPETVAKWSDEDREAVLKSPDQFIDKVVDRKGLVWEREAGGGWTTPSLASTLDLQDLIEKRVEAPRTFTMEDFSQDSSKNIGAYVDNLPEGSALIGPDGQRVTTKNGAVFIYGREIPSSQVDVVLNSLVVGDVVHHKSTTSATAIKELQSTKNALDASLSGMPDSIRNLVTTNTHIKSPEGRAYVDKKPNVSAVVMPPVGSLPARLELPEQNLDFDSEVQNNMGVSSLKINLRDLMGRDFPDGVKASFSVNGNGNSFMTTVNHETGHYFEQVLLQTLSPSERRDVFSDMAEAVLSELPEDARDGFDTFSLRRNDQYTNRVVRPGERGYELAIALEYAMSRSNGTIPSQLSSYATTNHAELIAESWADYKLNPNASPLAKKIGKILEDATKLAGRRIDKLRVGEAYEEKYSRAFKKPQPSPATAARTVFDAKDLTRTMRDSLDTYFKDSTDQIVDVLPRRGGFSLIWAEGSMEATSPVSNGISMNINNSVGAVGADLHAAALRLAKNSGIKHVVARTDKAIAAVLGYDFHPKHRDRVLQKIMSEVDKKAIPAKNQAAWDRIRDQVNSGTTSSITPSDIYAIGRFEDGNILDNIGEWVGYIDLDDFTKNDLSDTYKAPADPSLVPNPHGVPLSSERYASAADKLYVQAATALSKLSQTELDRLGTSDPKDKRSQVEQLAAKVVDAHYGANGHASDILLAYKVEDLIGRSTAPNNPPGLPDFDKWRNDNPEASDALDYLRERFGDINDAIRYNEDYADVEALDAAFDNAPRLTAPIQITIPTTRTTVLPSGKVIADKGFLRGSVDGDDDEDSPRLAVDLDEGQPIIWDGWNYVLPRYTQLTIVESDEGENLMRAEVRREPLPRDDFSTPPTERFQPPPRRRLRPDITVDDLRHMSVKEISDLFFGVGIPTEIFRWLLDLLDVAFAFAFVT